MASNASTIQDEVGAYPDWIELYNGTGEAVDLEGWSLTDDVTDPTRWTFGPDQTLEHGVYLLVWADSDIDEGPLHTNFNLDREGGDVALFDAGGTLVDAMEDYTFQGTDRSLARIPDGVGDFTVTEAPTPGAPNGE